LQLAESHRLAATLSAETLLSLYNQNPAAPPRPAETAPHVRRIIEEEEAASHALAEAARGYGANAAIHFDRFNTFELALFGVVMLVLASEGLCVVNPAVKRIQRFMDDLERSHVELKDYALKLERSNSELQDFASVASHDLQEPLRKVQAFSDRLRKRCAAALDDSGRDYLDRIQNAAARMQSLINDLLTYCRVATKAQPFVPTNLVSITREVVADLEARIEQVSGQVILGELPTLDADPLQVRQLMQNLIGNSLKYSRPDVPPVVKVWSKHEPHEPGTASGAPPRPFCEIVVEDNGIGFEQIYSERIFTIFQRLHGRNEYEGTGIGLAVCRRIVERHGGTITAHSTPGNGATFLVSLPIRQPNSGDN
jgi:light-regulated signal transduction histidine kinase (bacteriophytochrome)